MCVVCPEAKYIAYNAFGEFVNTKPGKLPALVRSVTMLADEKSLLDRIET